MVFFLLSSFAHYSKWQQCQVSSEPLTPINTISGTGDTPVLKRDDQLKIKCNVSKHRGTFNMIKALLDHPLIEMMLKLHQFRSPALQPSYMAIKPSNVISSTTSGTSRDHFRRSKAMKNFTIYFYAHSYFRDNHVIVRGSMSLQGLPRSLIRVKLLSYLLQL